MRLTRSSSTFRTSSGRRPSKSVLVVLQGIDASGKDGTIRRVMTAFNPQGCNVASFKVPTAEEAAHDFLWRIHKRTPGKGEIAIFNRSHYEQVLIVRVHGLEPRSVWSRHYDQINEFEELLAESGTTIVKFFLHISKDEQRQRIQERYDTPRKRWKFSMGDLEERKLWDKYMAAYEDALSRPRPPRRRGTSSRRIGTGCATSRCGRVSWIRPCSTSCWKPGQAHLLVLLRIRVVERPQRHFIPRRPLREPPIPIVPCVHPEPAPHASSDKRSVRIPRRIGRRPRQGLFSRRGPARLWRFRCGVR